MDKEIQELVKYYQIIVLPQEKRDSTNRNQEGRFTLDESLVLDGSPISNKIVLSNFGVVIWILITEIFRSGKGFYILRHLRKMLVLIKRSLHKAQLFEEVLLMHNYDKSNDVIYPVWMDESAVAMSVLKKKGVIRSFSFRLHGYDLFDDRRDGNYMEFREICFKSVNSVFTLSQAGTDYVKKKFPSKSIITTYSGLYDHGMGPTESESDVFTLVSCSNVIPLKRIDRIISTLNNCSRRIHWVHFGDGEDMDKIKRLTDSFSENIYFELKGHVTNSELIKFYQSNFVDLFIHLSETEGLGMVLVEAHSFGIPTLACNVGGVPEVVIEGTGLLIPSEFDDTDLAKIVDNWELVMKEHSIEREKCRLHYQRTFNAEVNYKTFAELIETN